MRRKLFLFFLIVMFLGISTTAFLSYRSSKNILMENQRMNLRSETRITGDYIEGHVSDEGDLDSTAKVVSQMIGKRVTVIGQDGRVVGESYKPSSTLENHANRIEVAEALKNGEGSSIRYSTTEGKTMYYYAVRHIIRGKVYIIRLSMEFNAIEVLQQKFLSFFIISIAAGIIISSALAYFYINILTMPIRMLTRFATTISLGQYEKRININSKDEIGQLGHAFNLMAVRLEETITDLSDKKNKLVSILTSMDDGVVVVDENEKILIINPAAERVFDIDGDVTGRHFIEVVRNNDIEDIIKSIPEEEVEITINYPVIRQLRIKSTRVINYDRDNGNLGVLLVIQDTTKIKVLEKMRSDFVANVSHELKTPLTSIKGFAETLMYVEDRTTREKFLNIINIEAERLSRLINDILILSELENRDGSFSSERININNSVEEVCYIMQPLADGKNIDLEYSKPEENAFILGDRDKFKQMMINLVDNAIKYTNEGGKVCISLKKEQSSVEILVKDNGMGIPEEHIPRLFERFYRADKARARALGGTGLGLAIVKHVVMVLKGEIDVSSSIGKGTTFRIVLPLTR